MAKQSKQADAYDDYQASWRAEGMATYEARLKGNRFKLAEGDNTVRVLPGVPAGSVPFLEYMAHGDVGPNKRFVTCGRDTDGSGDCWLCDAQIPKLEKTGKRSYKARARAMAPKRQVVLQVAYLNSKDEYEGPIPWMMSGGGQRALSTQIIGVLVKGKRDVVHPAKGFDLEIERTGQGLKTTYGTVQPALEPTAIPLKIYEARKPLEELFPSYDEDYMQAAYHGREDEYEADAGGDDDDEEEGPAPADAEAMRKDAEKASKKAKKKGKKKGKEPASEKSEKKGQKKSAAPEEEFSAEEREAADMLDAKPKKKGKKKGKKS